MSGIVVFACLDCGHVVFPRLLVCSRCAGPRWREERAERGTVEAVTTSLATVRTENGPLVVARVIGSAERGDVVRLDRDGRAVVAHRAGS
jgi:uncharacterized OB-fold protein